MCVVFLSGETFDGLKKCKKETFVAESDSQNREGFFFFFLIDEAV